MAETLAIRDKKPCECNHGQIQHYSTNFEDFLKGEQPCWSCACRRYVPAAPTARSLLGKLLTPESTFVSPGGALLIVDPVRLDVLTDEERDLLAEVCGR